MELFRRWRIEGTPGGGPPIAERLAEAEAAGRPLSSVALPEGAAEAPAPGASVGAGSRAGAPEGSLGDEGAGKRGAAEPLVLAILRVLEDGREAVGLHARLAAGAAAAERCLDAVLAGVAAARPPKRRLYALARWLVECGTHPVPVRCGLGLLGLVGGARELPLLERFARHEGFTRVAVAALARLGYDDEARLMALARSLSGWGRIEIVGRLASRPALSPATRRWLLLEGYKNRVFVPETAVACARAGRLAEALAAAHPDEALLDAAADLLGAAADGGPAEDWDDYEDAERALQLWLRAIETRSPKLTWGESLLWIEARLQATGSPLLPQVEAALARPEWRTLVEAALRREDGYAYQAASEIARRIGFDAWPIHFARLEAEDAPVHWRHACETSDPERIRTLVAHAEATLPLEAIATGPGEARGIGPAYEPHQKLDCVLALLPDHPGLGWPLVRAALQSPVIDQRRRAAAVLDAWPRGVWPVEPDG